MGRVSRLPAVRTSSKSEPVGPRPRLSAAWRRIYGRRMSFPALEAPEQLGVRLERIEPLRRPAVRRRRPLRLGERHLHTPMSVEQGEEQMSTAKSSDTAQAERVKQEESAAGSAGYLLAGQASELERLQVQSRVWEPSGRRLLEEIGDGRGSRTLDVGCGVLGWLRVLSEWVGPDGDVTGTDVDEAMLATADRFVSGEGLRNVGLVRDDLFASELEPASFDLVHARYEITPLGRSDEQMETYIRLARPGGTIVLEDPDTASWRFNPPAHPYLRLPLQFATSLEQRLLSLVSADELEGLRTKGEAELQEPDRWGTTFTLVQFWGRCPA